MVRDVFMAAVFMMAGAVVQAQHCSSDSACPSGEQSQDVESLLQTKLHTSEAGPDRTGPDRIGPELPGHGEAALLQTSMKSVMSSTLTNGGTLTLQGTKWDGAGGQSGIPMTCSIPKCSRSCTHGVECCATQMFEALSQVTSWMNKSNVEYVLLFGTLLGAHRNNDIIQWTGDLDIGIYAKDVVKLTKQTDIPWNFGYKDSFVIPRGCENHHKGFPGKYSNFVMGNGDGNDMACGGGDGGDPLACTYYIDLYVLDSPTHGGDIAKTCIASSLGPDGSHVNQSVVKIRGQEFDAPSDVEGCLVAKYGSGWKTPDHDKTYHR